jgi:signal peptide peptidase SppA
MNLFDLLSSPFAMTPAAHAEMIEIYLTHLRGEKIDLAGIEAKLGGPLPGASGGYELIDGVAVVPIDGPLMKKMNLMTKVSGGTSTDILRQNVQSAAEDRAAHSIVLLTDSPGGSVMGIIEAHDAIKAADRVKPVVALTDGVMASAAYWLGSAARAVHVSSETNVVGSIGVIYRHIDRSGADAKAGLKVTDIYAGKYKTALSDAAPLSEEAQADMQAKVDKLYRLFVDAVARNRGVDAQTVLKHMAEGRVFLGSDAINAGLVDGVSTLDALIAGLNAGRVPARKLFLPPVAGVAAAYFPLPQSGAGDAWPGAIVIQPQSGASMTINREFLNANHADLVETIRLEGYQRGEAEGRLSGAAAELARIQAVEAQALPGHETLIKAIKFDGKTTGPEAAVQVLAAEKALGASRLAALAGDAPKPAAHAITPTDKSRPEDKAEPKADSAEAFDAAIATNVEAGLSRGKAISKAVKELPEAHAAWIELRNAA